MVPNAAGAAPRGPAVVVASSEAELASKLKSAQFLPGQQVYALVIDKPGDLQPLLRAAATDLNVNISSSGATLTDSAMASGATGWLYKVVNAGDPDNAYKRFINYVRPAMYAAK
jgi:hypothetical protein